MQQRFGKMLHILLSTGKISARIYLRTTWILSDFLKRIYAKNEFSKLSTIPDTVTYKIEDLIGKDNWLTICWPFVTLNSFITRNRYSSAAQINT